jgi:hypothetical protein
MGIAFWYNTISLLNIVWTSSTNNWRFGLPWKQLQIHIPDFHDTKNDVQRIVVLSIVKIRDMNL